MSYALIAHKEAPSGNGTSVTTVGVDTTGANLLIAAVSWVSGSGGITLSDSKSNSGWTQLTAQTNGVTVAIWYCIPTSVGASHTFTATTTSGSVFPTIAIAAFSGAASSSVFDVENGNTGGGSTTTGSITPGSANELIIAGVSNNAIAPTSIDSGFTITDTQAPGGNNYGLGLAYLIQTSASAVNPTWTAGSGSVAAVIASFKASGGAPPAGGLFLPAQLAGLGSGGPFFQNPLN